jgi:hypothetical protein
MVFLFKAIEKETQRDFTQERKFYFIKIHILDCKTCLNEKKEHKYY